MECKHKNGIKFTPYYLTPPSQIHFGYSDSLFHSLGESFNVQRMSVSKGGWKRLQNECYHKCTDLAELDNSFKPVRGQFVLSLLVCASLYQLHQYLLARS
jgi:hypothetical protein